MKYKNTRANYIKLLDEYNRLSKQQKDNMAKMLKFGAGWTGSFKEYARINSASARKGLNAVLQMGDLSLMIDGVDGKVIDNRYALLNDGTINPLKEEGQNIYPNYNPNDPVS